MTHSEEWRARHRDTFRAEHMEIWAVGGIGEVEEGTDLGSMLGALDLHDGDVVLVTSKIVSKAEGRVRSGDRSTAIEEETVRVVIFSSKTSLAVVAYPDSHKVGIWTKADSVTLFDDFTYTSK